jgi:hypothetical protein
MTSLHTLTTYVPAPAHPLLALIQRYRAIHTGIGILGNALFLVGSLVFLLGPTTPAIWLFVAGSTGMLIGSVGSALVQLHERRSRHGGERSASR